MDLILPDSYQKMMGGLTPEKQQEQLHKILLEYQKHMPAFQRKSRVIAYLKQGMTYERIAKQLNISRRDICEIKKEWLNSTTFGTTHI